MSENILSDLVERYEMANYTINHRLGSKVKERLPAELTNEQLGILRYLYRAECSTTSELADVMCVAKSTITSTVNRMVNKGLITRDPSETDRRVIYLRMTDEGNRLFRIVEQEIQKILIPYLEKVEEEEAHQLIEILEKIVHVLNDERK